MGPEKAVAFEHIPWFLENRAKEQEKELETFMTGERGRTLTE